MQIFPNIALTIFTTDEQIFQLFQRRLILEMYARGRSGINCDTVKLADVTFIARNRHTFAYALNANFSQYFTTNTDDI